ncbi:hypothetical protein HK096_009237, partial [Nowakowskiella sp. JEL0078]
WTDEIPISPPAIRLLLRGKFLEANSTIEACGIPGGDITTVHLLVKNDITLEPAEKQQKDAVC